MAELTPWVPQRGGGGGAPPKVGATVAALGVGAFDGQTGLLRVGAWPNVHEELLAWNAAAGRWVGEERVLVTQGDTWAMDLGNRTGAQLLDYSFVDNAVPYGKSYALLQGAHDLSAAAFAGGTGVITVDDTLSPHSFPFSDTAADSPLLQIRENYLSYTGRTATTFTGCRLVQGSGGVIPASEYVVQGYPGGWGFTANPIVFAAELWAAGLRLQERLSALMNSAPGVPEKKLTVAPYWTQYDVGDGGQLRTTPPTGGIGASAGLTSLAGTGGPITANERSFYMTPNGWTDWPLAAPTKRFLLPRIVGKMEAGAVLCGSVLDLKLAVRWVS